MCARAIWSFVACLTVVVVFGGVWGCIGEERSSRPGARRPGGQSPVGRPVGMGGGPQVRGRFGGQIGTSGTAPDRYYGSEGRGMIERGTSFFAGTHGTGQAGRSYEWRRDAGRPR